MSMYQFKLTELVDSKMNQFETVDSALLSGRHHSSTGFSV